MPRTLLYANRETIEDLLEYYVELRWLERKNEKDGSEASKFKARIKKLLKTDDGSTCTRERACKDLRRLYDSSVASLEGALRKYNYSLKNVRFPSFAEIEPGDEDTIKGLSSRNLSSGLSNPDAGHFRENAQALIDRLRDIKIRGIPERDAETRRRRRYEDRLNDLKDAKEVLTNIKSCKVHLLKRMECAAQGLYRRQWHSYEPSGRTRNDRMAGTEKEISKTERKISKVRKGISRVKKRMEEQDRKIDTQFRASKKKNHCVRDVKLLFGRSRKKSLKCRIGTFDDMMIGQWVRNLKSLVLHIGGRNSYRSRRSMLEGHLGFIGKLESRRNWSKMHLRVCKIDRCISSRMQEMESSSRRRRSD